jgi:hypothetical protein
LVLPTTGKRNKKLSWTFYAFGSEAPSSMRTSASFFDNALESLNDVGTFAIYIGDENKKVLLVQDPTGRRQYTINKIQDMRPGQKPQHHYKKLEP